MPRDDTNGKMSTSSSIKRIQSNALDESSFTSFSDLGAAIPSSEGDGLDRGSGESSSISLLSVSGLKTLLHPSAHVNETTPLLRSEQKKWASRRRKGGRRYVGGREVFAAHASSDVDETSPLLENGEIPLAVCRHCEEYEAPISAGKLAIISQILFGLMSLLAEILARDGNKERMGELQILSIQAAVLYVVTTGILLFTKTEHA
jgi:hypothetical protein